MNTAAYRPSEYSAYNFLFSTFFFIYLSNFLLYLQEIRIRLTEQEKKKHFVSLVGIDRSIWEVE